MTLRLILLELRRHPVIAVLLGISSVAMPVLIAILLMILMTSSTSWQSPCGSQSTSNSGGDDSTSTAGAEGSWTHKGTKEYNMAKEVYAAAKAQGCDDKHAAAVVGNAAHESMRFSLGWKVTQQGGGPGIGIFQFNRGANEPSSWGASGQVKRILQEGGHPTTSNCDGAKGGMQKSSWEHESGSVNKLTEDFECSFEAGGDADMSSRDAMANKAYQMFDGVGGSSSDSSDTASSGSGDCGSSGSDSGSGDGSDIVSFAKKYLGLGYTLGGDSHDIAEGKPKSEVKQTDCNKFAWAVATHEHYTAGPYPGNCANSISNLHKYKVSANQTHSGSLLICNAHAMILEEKYHGDKTKIINEGPNKVWETEVGPEMEGVSRAGWSYFNLQKK